MVDKTVIIINVDNILLYIQDSGTRREPGVFDDVIRYFMLQDYIFPALFNLHGIFRIKRSNNTRVFNSI